jgi:predicted transcriptional regulator
MKREAVTIRFPAELVRKAKQLKDGGELFNELVVGALEQEVKRRQAWAAHQSVIAR